MSANQPEMTIDEVLNEYKVAITEESGTAWGQEERIADVKTALSAMVAEIIGEKVALESGHYSYFQSLGYDQAIEDASQRAAKMGFKLNKEGK